jgi:alpha-N-arabinofuranosidase
MLSVLGSVAVLASVVNALNLTVSSTGGNATSALQYGIMFEDINHSGDGGIYAELIQNRAFQGSSLYPSVIDPWTAVGAVSLSLSESTTPLSEALPTSLRVSLNDSTQWRGERIGIKNPGWWGIDVKEQQYTGSFWSMGAYNGKFVASLESSLTDDVWATAEINGNGEDGKWREYEFCLTPKVAAPNVNNTFSLTFTPETGGLGLEFGLISLFPPTYKNRQASVLSF